MDVQVGENVSDAGRLRGEMLIWLEESVAAVWRRFLGGEPAAGRLAGFPVLPDVWADLAYDLGYLRDAGLGAIDGVQIEDAVRRCLEQIDGAGTETFYSYRTAETIARWGRFEGNPLLRSFDEARRSDLALACDSSGIYRPEDGTLGGKPRNYWGVLARCEAAREALGILPDRRILDIALGRIGEALFENAHGFFDDDIGGQGRYDIYSFDVHLFMEPLWDRLDPQLLSRNLEAHIALFDKLVRENGACVAWGRSVGVLSVCMTIEWASMCLARGLAPDPGRYLGLTAYAFEQLRGWFEDGLINAHRERSPFEYRGPHRLFQLTLDVLGKVGYTIKQLASVPEDVATETDPDVLFPEFDEWTAFDERGAGVWTYRRDGWSFQLPNVFHHRSPSDYGPSPKMPGALEAPVDSSLPVCGAVVRMGDGVLVPRAFARPEAKEPCGVTLAWEGFHREVSDGVGKRRLAGAVDGARRLGFHVEGDALVVEERISLEKTPHSITASWAESGPGLALDPAATGDVRTSEVAVEGIKPFRSFWSSIRNWKEVHVPAASESVLCTTVRTVPRVLAIPGEHDYVRNQWAPLEESGRWQVTRLPALPLEALDVPSLERRFDAIHLGWPEHLVPGDKSDWGAYFPPLRGWFEALGRSRLRVVWTMHNKLPHKMADERGEELFRTFAPAADLVLHHSECGMHEMRERLPYKVGARHVVLPHGAYPFDRDALRSRAELEAAYGLEPVSLRLGLLGLYQPGKRIEEMLRAFAACGRDDMQLLLTAARPGLEIPDDPRIRVLPRDGLYTREQIWEQLALVDALMAFPRPECYLTTGQVADAVGAGIPIIGNDWAFLSEILGEGLLCFGRTEDELRGYLGTLDRASVERAGTAAAALRGTYDWSTLAGTLETALRKTLR